MSESNLPAVQQAAGLTATRFREATDVASVCRDIVTKTAVQIGSRNYVRVEGWTSIAVAHGCIASVKPGSVREILRDGKVLVRRPDAEELRGILRGEWKYEDIEAAADSLDARLDALYESSPLQKQPDRKKLADLYREICEKRYGVNLK